MSQNLSSATVVIGALRVNQFIVHVENPETSSTMRVLIGACCSGTYLYS